ncbi:ABC-type transport auxiliary lipoprotein family protein [Thiolapillus sp.]
MKIIRCLLILGMLLLLPACAREILPPVTEYTLAPVLQMPASSGKPLSMSIKLSPIVASQVFSTTDLYYGEAGFSRNRYAYSRWEDTPVNMLQLVLQDGLEQSGLFRAVLPSSSMAEADVLLETTLFDFSQHLQPDGGSVAVVRMRFYLMHEQGRLLASKEFESRVATRTTDAKGAVAAINTAVANIVQDLVLWLPQVLGR